MNLMLMGLLVFAANLFKSCGRLEAENVLLRHQLNIALRRIRNCAGTMTRANSLANTYVGPERPQKSDFPEFLFTLGDLIVAFWHTQIAVLEILNAVVIVSQRRDDQ